MKKFVFDTRVPASRPNPTILVGGAAALVGMLVIAHAQFISITNSTTYTQNFDALGTTTAAWVDNGTIAGWYAGINANATADGNLTISDGSTAISGLLNLGTTGAADRALGSKVTSTGALANAAYGVLFQNTSTSALDITNIGYTGELWRTNTTAGGLAEQWVTFFKISSTLFTDTEPGGTSATANTGTFTALTALNWSSPTNLPITTQLDGNAAANRTVLSTDPNLILNPGEYFMFRWVDTNIAGTDGHQGIDDFSISFATIIVANNLTYNRAHTVGGAPDGNLEVSASQYWLNVATPSGFASGDNALFTQDGGATINVPADITVGGVTVSNATGTYSIGGAGKIAGPLTKSNVSSLALTSANTLTAVTLSGGTIVASAGALGTTAPLTVSGTGGTLQTVGDVTVGSLNGTGPLLKTGAATLIVSAAGTATGGLSITSGTVNVPSSAGVGGITQNVTISNNATLLFSATTGAASVFNDATTTTRTITVGTGGATIDVFGTTGATGSGVTLSRPDSLLASETITKVGGGVLRMAAAQATSTSPWIVNAGTLEARATGGLGSGSVTVNPGGLLIAAGDVAGLIVGNNVTLAGGSLGTKSGNLATFGGTINVTAPSQLLGRSNSTPAAALTFTISGPLTGSANLTVPGAIPLLATTLGGVILTNTANTYSGNITITSLQTLTSAPAGGVGSTLSTAGITLAGGTLAIRDSGAGSTGTLAYGNNVTVIAPTDAGFPGVATLNLDRAAAGTNTDNTVQFGSFTLGGSALSIVGANGYGTRFTGGSITADATLEVIANTTVSGAISGSFGLTKSGTGRLTLNGTNTFTGPLTVSGGALGGNGSVAGALNNTTTTLSPGEIGAAGIFGVGTDLTFGSAASGATLSLTIAHGAGLTPVAGTDYDRVNVGTGGLFASTGAVTLGGSTLQLTVAPDILTGDIFFVIINDGVDTIPDTFNGLADDATITAGGFDFRISYNADSSLGTIDGGNDVALLALIPEPGSALLALVGGAGLLARRRRR